MCHIIPLVDNVETKHAKADVYPENISFPGPYDFLEVDVLQNLFLFCSILSVWKIVFDHC